MIRSLSGALSIDSGVFGFFSPVYLFGSALWSDSPNDIDILLVYIAVTPDEVNTERARVAQALASELPSYIIDLTTLSTSELQQTDFLSRVSHRLIKG